MMAGRQIRGVIHRFRIDSEAARRLDGDKDVANFKPLNK